MGTGGEEGKKRTRRFIDPAQPRTKFPPYGIDTFTEQTIATIEMEIAEENALKLREKIMWDIAYWKNMAICLLIERYGDV